MNKELFKKYADIKNQIKELTAEAHTIEKEVVSEMNTQDVKEVKSDFGTFYFSTRKSWTYSELVIEVETTVEDEITEIEEKYKTELGEVAEVRESGGVRIEEAREKDIADETATVVEKKSLVFRGKKIT